MPGTGEISGRPPAELDSVVVEGSQLGEIAISLLEVVAENLLELDFTVPLAVDALGPVGESLVHRRARAFEDPEVGGVADEEVVKAIVGLDLGHVRSNELLGAHRTEVLLGRCRPEISQVLDRCSGEEEPDHGRRLDDDAFLGRKQVEPRRQQRLNRAGDSQLR